MYTWTYSIFSLDTFAALFMYDIHLLCTNFQIKYWDMLYYVHTCIVLFFHISYNPVSTHITNQIIHYVSTKFIGLYTLPCRNCMTDHAQRNNDTISCFTKFCLSVMINSHISSTTNWYWTQTVYNYFFKFIFLIFYLFIYLFIYFLIIIIIILLVIWKSCDLEIPS